MHSFIVHELLSNLAMSKHATACLRVGTRDLLPGWHIKHLFSNFNKSVGRISDSIKDNILQGLSLAIVSLYVQCRKESDI